MSSGGCPIFWKAAKIFIRRAEKRKKLAISGGKMPAQRLHISGCGPQCSGFARWAVFAPDCTARLTVVLAAFSSALGAGIEKAEHGPNSSSLYSPFCRCATSSPGRGKSFATGSGRRRSCSNPPAIVKFKISYKAKDQRNFYTGLFGGRGWITRAALLKTAHRAVFAPSSATSPQLFESTRICEIQDFV